MLRDLSRLERLSTAELIACIAEVDQRRLYLRNGCSSMFAYCVEILHLSESAAWKRIQVARLVQRNRRVCEALRDGRLHLYSVCLLAPHLTEENSERLLGEAEGRSTRQVEEMIASLKPRTETLPMVHVVPEVVSSPSRPSAQSQPPAQEVLNAVPEQMHHYVEPVPMASTLPPRIKPIAHQRYSVEITLGKSGHEDLEALRDLLSHRVPSGNLNEIVEYTIGVVRRLAERRKFGTTSRPRAPREHTRTDSRLIPAHVRRAVCERDGNQCTFVGENGHRCTERRFLEFHHVRPFARGAETTVDNLRLRCRAHNQHEADEAFGADFMEQKRKPAPREAVCG